MIFKVTEHRCAGLWTCQVEELQASHSRMRWDLIQKLAAAGAPPEAPPPGAPKLSAAALQTLSDLDARVHRMRRDLDDYKHRVPARPPASEMPHHPSMRCNESRASVIHGSQSLARHLVLHL